ncbi:MAG: RNA polymerase sigma factor RpoS [Phycisphaerae bacterium]|nr:RNA polymerase sigma factor RpoS [Phycisphaerae bacterium]
MSRTALSDERQGWVNEHLQLVQKVLRRYRPSRHHAHREAADLYQEGCLGLIRAAEHYDPASQIPFAAYAQRRIQQTISQALYEQNSTIRVPMRTQLRHRDRHRPDEGGFPVIHSLEIDPVDQRHEPAAGVSVNEQLHDRLREAARRAGVRAKKSTGRRGDRDILIDRLVDERLLISTLQEKTPLRQIARETRSSYSRVAGCERQLLNLMRQELQQDRDCQLLLLRATHDTAAEADEPHWRVAQFERLLSEHESAAQHSWLWEILEQTGGEPSLLLCRLFARLTQVQQDDWLARLLTAPSLG